MAKGRLLHTSHLEISIKIQNLIQKVCDGTRDSAFPLSSQVKLIQLFHEPHFCSKDLDRAKCPQPWTQLSWLWLLFLTLVLLQPTAFSIPLSTRDKTREIGLTLEHMTSNSDLKKLLPNCPMFIELSWSCPPPEWVWKSRGRFRAGQTVKALSAEEYIAGCRGMHEMNLKGAFPTQYSVIMNHVLGFDKGRASVLPPSGQSNDPGCQLETSICGVLELQAKQWGSLENRGQKGYLLLVF